MRVKVSIREERGSTYEVRVHIRERYKHGTPIGDSAQNVVLVCTVLVFSF